MTATIRFVLVVFVVLAVMAPWAMGPFIDGVTEFTVAVGDIISETVTKMHEGP